MSVFKRTIIALDGTEKDLPLLKHASKYLQRNEVEKIYFVHVQESLDLPKEVLEKYPDMMSPLDESIRENIEKLVTEHIPYIKDMDYDLMVEEGDPAETIIKLSKRKQATMVILGKNSSGKKTGAIARKIASFSPSSIMFAPELLNEETPKVLLPINFSDTSKEALEQVEEIAELIDNVEVVAVNCYKVPSGYSSVGKSYEEMTKILGDVSQKKLDKFVSTTNNSDNIKTVSVLVKDDENVADTVYKYAKQEDVNIIVIGSKSRTWMASMLLSSTAEQLLQSDINIPLMIYKNKKKTLDVFDFFERI
ncbi:universal stress protein [Flammeovirga yaeyamensis]|uniref:Universal stress protein n=1 Tax=Flammeovirga yaeyamensis TaxID=367791 RepID=A0AAX1N491_9BACT|nr:MULTISPECIES: universal stress protein [Flammeovirga]ANQ47736.1 universal stress protein [Flammeovirga sp. MY04]MBB3700199.1 nucleotide-binding universal stress UspA family protein [Flammeovirga yaeyamensis]NMF37171.1 universal stress protein [Flammeovirga yaeyamensis]QWG00862.1 universal stress protein [Flammeovirga yaeyamensis]